MKKFLILGLLVSTLFGCSAGKSQYISQYVLETSNGLEKEGKIVEKVKWNAFDDVPVRVTDKFTGEVVLFKGYNPCYSSDKQHFYVYGIVESDKYSETYTYMRFDSGFYTWEKI